MTTFPEVDTTKYPLYADALRRHAEWAVEYAEIGDVGATMEALMDFRAISSELVLSIEEE